MFGYDDDKLNDIIQEKPGDEHVHVHVHVHVQMSLDRSQASGVHEKQILARWATTRVATASPSAGRGGAARSC